MDWQEISSTSSMFARSSAALPLREVSCNCKHLMNDVDQRDDLTSEALLLSITLELQQQQ